MVDLILLELISMVSFLYSLMLMFIAFTSIDKMVILFTWTILAGTLFSVGRKKWKIFDLTALLMLLPLLFYKEKSAVFLISLTGVFTYIYVVRALMKGSYGEYVHKLKISYLVYLPLLFTSTWLEEDLTGSLGYALPFIIIYLISSIMLVRLIRHLESNMEISKIRRMNTKYLLTIFAGFLIIVFKDLRESIKDVLEKLIIAMYYPLSRLFDDFSMPPQIAEAIQRVFPFMGRSSFPEDDIIEQVEIIAEEASKNGGIANKVLIFSLFIFILYIAYKLFIRMGSKGDRDTEYIEEREYIRERKKRKLFNKDKYPEGVREQIRYYYRRYLDKVKKKDIEILKSDTSLDINNKSKYVFDEKIDRIREIYIESRYCSKTPNDSTVKEMEKLYKDL